MVKAFSESYELSTGLPGEHTLPAELFTNTREPPKSLLH